MSARLRSPLSEYDPELALYVIEGMKRRGWSQSRIAEHFGVSRQAISYYVRKYGGMRTARQILLEDHYPFNVPAEFHNATQNRRLRDHGEYFATRGKDMDPEKLRRLRTWYQMLRDEDLIVEFDPNLPPEPGISSVGGFTYRRRTPEDGDLLIRINEHTNITEKGMKIWRFPKREP